MWPNLHETADLVTFTEKKSLMENFIFWAVISGNLSPFVAGKRLHISSMR